MFQTIVKVLACVLCGVLVLGGCTGQTEVVEVAEVSEHELLPETSPLDDSPKGVVVINESSKYVRNIVVSHRRGTVEEALAGNERVRVEIELLKPGEEVLVPSDKVMGGFTLGVYYGYTEGPIFDPLRDSIPNCVSLSKMFVSDLGGRPIVYMRNDMQGGVRVDVGMQ